LKTVDTKRPFEHVCQAEFNKYVEHAQFVQNNGLHSDKSVIQLAKIIYEKAINNER
jgi:hypothetical protein